MNAAELEAWFAEAAAAVSELDAWFKREAADVAVSELDAWFAEAPDVVTDWYGSPESATWTAAPPPPWTFPEIHLDYIHRAMWMEISYT